MRGTMENLILFLNSFFSYFVLMLIILAVAAVALAIGVALAKRKNKTSGGDEWQSPRDKS